MEQLKSLYERYKKANSNVNFYHWLEGDSTNIGELAKDLGFSTVEELRSACKKIEKNK